MKNFQSKSAQKFSIKVWWKQVKNMYIQSQNHSPSEDCTGARFFNQGLFKYFQSRSAEKISIGV